MATANQPASQKILAMLRGCDESDIVGLDKEIAQAESQVGFLKRLRAAVGVGLKMAKNAPGDESSGPPIESKAVQPAVTEATKPVMRQKIVQILKSHGKRRCDLIQQEIGVDRDAALELLAHKWFCGVQGGFTLTSEGYVEANRLEGK